MLLEGLGEGSPPSPGGVYSRGGAPVAGKVPEQVLISGLEENKPFLRCIIISKTARDTSK